VQPAQAPAATGAHAAGTRCIGRIECRLCRIWNGGLGREVALLDIDHPNGFALRLHNLGDFYSTTYVDLWRKLLERHSALHVWGYTAHWDIKDDSYRRCPHYRYAADLRPRAHGGAISASAGMPHSRCSFQAILIVRGRFLVRMSDARWREPSSRPRSAWV
jgi:hypothetical protein